MEDLEILWNGSRPIGFKTKEEIGFRQFMYPEKWLYKFKLFGKIFEFVMIPFSVKITFPKIRTIKSIRYETNH